MKRLRELILGHRIAAAIMGAAVLAFVGWEVYGMVGQSAPVPASITPRAAGAAAPPAPGQPGMTAGAAAGPSGSAALRAAGHLAGVPAPRLPGAPADASAAAGAAPAAAAPHAAVPTASVPSAAAPSDAVSLAGATTPQPATGRPDPFSPLATTGVGGPSSPPLPPVPPLAPGALPPGAVASAPGVPAPPGPGSFHLMGILSGPTALAILGDGAGSYIVQPGDTVTPGVRMVAIDMASRTVTLASKDHSWQLALLPVGGGTAR